MATVPVPKSNEVANIIGVNPAMVVIVVSSTGRIRASAVRTIASSGDMRFAKS